MNVSTELKTYRYKGDYLYVVMMGNIPWFSSKAISTILGYDNVTGGIEPYCEPSHLLTCDGFLKKIELWNQLPTDTEFWGLVDDFVKVLIDKDDTGLYIQLWGVYELILAKPSVEADLFLNWLGRVFLPSIETPPP